MRSTSDRGGVPSTCPRVATAVIFSWALAWTACSPDLLKKVGVQPRDSEQLKLSRIETSDVQPSPAVQHDRATV